MVKKMGENHEYFYRLLLSTFVRHKLFLLYVVFVVCCFCLCCFCGIVSDRGALKQLLRSKFDI